MYNVFDKVRHEGEFPLDGFVVKPGAMYRLQDGDRTRQEDCVAVKFLPEIVDATLIDVEWNVGKTGEYYPTGILGNVILGGKNVNRVSLSNYGKIIEDKIGIGSHLKISLAGDIIPYCLQVVTDGSPITLPEDSYVDGVHLMKKMSDKEKMYIKFINSVNVIKPDGIGEKVATKLFEIFPTDNILDFMIKDEWKESLDDSKSSQNIINSLNERKKTLSMTNLIQSMGYENCGEKNSAWLADKLCGLNPDTKGIPTTIIELSENYEFNSKVTNYMLAMDVKPVKKEDTSDKTPVVLTGSPKKCGYNTKADFLAKHPQFVETTKWTECKILFTDDLESTSSKMEKAKKLGIEIKRYI
jgi:NAD-dependent DNA ligase